MMAFSFVTWSASSFTALVMSATIRRRTSSGLGRWGGPPGPPVPPVVWTDGTRYSRYANAPTTAPLTNTTIRDKSTETFDLVMDPYLVVRPIDLEAYRADKVLCIGNGGLGEGFNIALRGRGGCGMRDRYIQSHRQGKCYRCRRKGVSHATE